MIDFISTRSGTDPQTAACARLLACVIAQAIRDACKKPMKEEKNLSKNIDGESTGALRFLVGEDSAFPLYASLIGSSAADIRKALLMKSESSIPLSHQFSDVDRRILQWRVRQPGFGRRVQLEYTE